MAPQCPTIKPLPSGVALKVLGDLAPAPPGFPVHSFEHPTCQPHQTLDT